MGKGVNKQKRGPFIEFVNGFFQEKGNLPTPDEVEDFYNSAGIEGTSQYSPYRAGELLRGIGRVAVLHKGGNISEAIDAFRPEEKEGSGGRDTERRGG